MAFLPFEIITEILIRVPVKPLIRFKCVSKPWNSLISSQKFIKNHLKQTLITNPSPQNVIISQRSLFTSGINLHFTELNHPLKRKGVNYDVVLTGSCNGIVLISDTVNKTMHMYNPIMNSNRFLPRCQSSSPPPDPALHDAELLLEAFGLGYDSLNDDYKVVRIHQLFYTVDGPSGVASIYSLRDDVWKSVKYDIMPYFLPPNNCTQHAVAAKEMLHFIAASKDLTPVLLCFDLWTETFSIVDYPELNFKLDKHDFYKMTMSLRELHGCLCLLVNYREHRGPAPIDWFHKLLYADVWEMRERGKKESWVKLFRIQSHDIPGCRVYLSLVTCSEDKRKVLLEVDSRWFGWYDLVSRRIESVAVQGWKCESFYSVGMTFVESLVSVSNDKVVAKEGTLARTTTKKARFLSSGFKLKL